MKNSEQPVRIIDNTHLYPVLTKREYFAAIAMQGLLSNNSLREEIQKQFPKSSSEEQYIIISVSSIRIADELLKQLENQ